MIEFADTFYTQIHRGDYLLNDARWMIENTPKNVIGEVQHTALMASMLFSALAVEAFIDSHAFLAGKAGSLDYNKYLESRRRRVRRKAVFDALQIDKCKNRKIIGFTRRMTNWRDLVVHPKPYEAGAAGTKFSSWPEFHKSHAKQDYLSYINRSAADEFLASAHEFAELLERVSGRKPLAMADKSGRLAAQFGYIIAPPSFD